MKNLFPQRLKELREEAHKYQKDLAKDLNLTQAAVTHWEKGRNQPDYDMLITIAEYFGVTVDYLIGKTDY